MEYGIEISNIPNDQFIKHVGFSYDDENTIGLQTFFSIENRKMLSKKITQLLKGVDSKGRSIIVPDASISSIMSAAYSTFRPETGDIYTRYNIPQNGSPDYVARLNDQVINIITSQVKNNLEMDRINSKLTIWSTVLGDFNMEGLRSHPIIKLKERRAAPFLFNMNY